MGWERHAGQGRGRPRGRGLLVSRYFRTHKQHEGGDARHTMQQCARSVLEWKPVLRGLTSRSTLSPSQTATRWPLCESTAGPTGQVWGLQAAVTRHRRHLKDAHDNGVLGASGKRIGGEGRGVLLGGRAGSVCFDMEIWRNGKVCNSISYLPMVGRGCRFLGCFFLLWQLETEPLDRGENLGDATIGWWEAAFV